VDDRRLTEKLQNWLRAVVSVMFYYSICQLKERIMYDALTATLLHDICNKNYYLIVLNTVE